MLRVDVMEVIITPEEGYGPVGGDGVCMRLLTQGVPILFLRNEERVEGGRRDTEPRRRYITEIVSVVACLRPVWCLALQYGC